MPSDMNVSHSALHGVVTEPVLDPAAMAAIAKANRPLAKSRTGATTTERVSSSHESSASSDWDLDPPLKYGEVSASEVLEVIYRLQMELREDRAVNRWIARDNEVDLLNKQADDIRSGALSAFICGIVGGALATGCAAIAFGKVASAAKAGPSDASKKMIENLEKDAKPFSETLTEKQAVLKSLETNKLPQLEGDLNIPKPPAETSITARLKAIDAKISERPVDEQAAFRTRYSEIQKVNDEVNSAARTVTEFENLKLSEISKSAGDATQKMFTWSMLLIQGGQGPGQISNAIGEYLSKQYQGAATEAEAAAKKESYTRQEQEEQYQDATKAMEEVRNILGQIISAEAKTIDRIIS